MIPICFRKMVHLQVLLLENNPLQSPPAQVSNICNLNFALILGGREQIIAYKTSPSELQASKLLSSDISC